MKVEQSSLFHVCFRITRGVAGTLGLCLGLGLSGCYPAKTPTDGGPIGPQAAQCTAGSYCLFVGNSSVRSCDVMLKADSTPKMEQVGFGAGVIGQSMQKDQRVGLSFVLEQDQPPASEKAIAVLTPPTGDQTTLTWEMTTIRCADSAGKTVESPEISIKKQ
ncbi:MAG: hypothetical protein H6728_02155 [Myxococcales bacterium]|nr:hypothetical protein [Myxococcales bacterium]MCB9641856.1 hypothetical protein [Myxococcales bacterium]